jgi:8-oxo-dGTP diphosphatase
VKLKVAAKAIFCHEGEVLIVADPQGKFDFPGGGIENDEDLTMALRREIKEELGWDNFPAEKKLVHVDEWFIPKLDLHVVAVFYQINLEGRAPQILSSEHSRTAWIRPENITQYDATPDTVRALEALAG